MLKILLSFVLVSVFVYALYLFTKLLFKSGTALKVFFGTLLVSILGALILAGVVTVF